MSRHPGLNLGTAHASADDVAEVEVFGFWVFMMSDAVLFGLLFASYAVLQVATQGAPGPETLFDMRSVLAQTLLLLTSSLTIGLAQLAVKEERALTSIIGWLLLSLLLAGGFLTLELRDLLSMIDQGGVPQANAFLSSFFALIPLHGLHVLAACVWLLALLGQMFVHGLDDAVKTAMLRIGILWHFLDLIWIGIFTIVYVGALA